MSFAVRTAIRLYPAVWREKYGAEVLGTLNDVADSHGGSVPLTETVALGARGLWLRARGSVAFWAGFIVIGLLVAHAAMVDVYWIDGSLTAMLITLNAGIGFALPVLAIASGWAGARSRAERIVGAGTRARRLFSDSWPLLAFALSGYVIAVIVLVIRVGSPWFAALGVHVILGQLAMVANAIAIGQLLGAVLPRVLTIFAAPAAAIAATALLTSWLTPWRLTNGDLYPGLAYVADLEPFLRLYSIAGVVVVSTVLVVCLRPVWARVLPVAALTMVAAVVAAQPFADTRYPSSVERPRSELVCSIAEPVICLWPEQEAAFGDELRDEMSHAYAVATALGLPVEDAGPRSVAQFALTQIPLPEGADVTDAEFGESFLGLGVTGMRPSDLLPFYANVIPAHYWEQPESAESRFVTLQVAIAVALGVPADEAWPALVDPYTGQQNFDPADMPDENTARRLIEQWLVAGIDGVRSPRIDTPS